MKPGDEIYVYESRAPIVVALVLTGLWGALVGWIAHMIMVAIRNG